MTLEPTDRAAAAHPADAAPDSPAPMCGAAAFPVGEPVAILDLPAAPGAVAAGRHWAVDAARSQGACDAVADAVELLASEVLGNAVRHGGTAGTLQVHVVRHGSRLRVTVQDRSPELPVVRRVGPAETSGRGMQLVETVAAAWGTHPSGTSGKTVWFEVALCAARRSA